MQDGILELKQKYNPCLQRQEIPAGWEWFLVPVTGPTSPFLQVRMCPCQTTPTTM